GPHRPGDGAPDPAGLSAEAMLAAAAAHRRGDRQPGHGHHPAGDHRAERQDHPVRLRSRTPRPANRRTASVSPGYALGAADHHHPAPEEVGRRRIEPRGEAMPDPRFFEDLGPVTLGELATLTGAVLADA